MQKPGRTVGVLLGILTLLDTSAVWSQRFPSRPVRFLTTGLGGSTDLAARTLAQGLTDGGGWTVVVDNRGSTIVAAETVAKATSDGYTLLVVTEGLWRGPLLQKMPFEALRDFAPITLVSRSPNILVVHPSLPAANVKELIALARSKPGELNYGAGAIGAATHMASELFKVMAGVNIVHVPFKSTGGALTPLLAGQLQLMFGTTAIVSTHIKSGKIRALAISTAKPSPLLPGLPTVAEAGGLPGFESAATAALFAPVATPNAMIQLLNEHATRALRRGDVRERFFNQSVDVVGGAPAETTAFIQADTATTAQVIKEAGIRVSR